MDRKEFSLMAMKIRPRLVAQAAKMLGNVDDADDVAQDTLLRLWQMRDSLDAYRTVEGMAFVMTRNLAIDRLRKPKSPGLESAPEPVANESTDAPLIASDVQHQLDDVMSRLVDSQRAVLKMRHIEGMEMDEIAEVLGTTPNNVRVLLSRARARVKQIFLTQKQ